MTTATTNPSPFSANSSASGMCGVTLMNNQVGVVMAKVMKEQEGVTITPLPSMIRVDALTRMDFVYADISEALGEEDDYFDAAQFEQSTHVEGLEKLG